MPRPLTQWPEGKLLRVSINNFGYGGTNAHIIIDGMPATNPMSRPSANGTCNNYDRSCNRVYVLSAKDAATAKHMLSQFAAHVRQCIASGQTLSPGDLAYTLAERRSLLPWRIVIRAKNLDELCSRLDTSTIQAPTYAKTRKPRLGFVFNGQGAQWYAMARELAVYSVFARAICEAEKVLKKYGATWSLYGTLVPSPHR